MLSNKLTFSLASLVVICVIGLALSVTPASGQVAGADTFELVTFTIPANTPANSFVIVQKANPVAYDSNTPNAVDAETSIIRSVRRVQGSNWVDLQDFFIYGGGTIELIGPDDVPASMVAKAKGDVVISEIMWGNDLAKGANNKDESQWIELYIRKAIGTTGEAWHLKLTKNKLVSNEIGGAAGVFVTAGNNVGTADDTYGPLTDVMSNYGLGYWPIAEDDNYGQSGNEVVTDNNNNTVVLPAKTRISMYRNLDYTKLEKTTPDMSGLVDGTRSDNWKETAAPRGANQSGSILATPGEKHIAAALTTGNATTVPYSPIIINEIGLSETATDRWIELRNVSTGEVNLKKWELNIITGTTAADVKEDNLVSFPDKDLKLGAGKILLIVNADPLDTPLARGMKLGDANGMTADADQENRGVKNDSLFYDAKSGLENPDGKGLDKLDGGSKFLLVVRNANDKEKSHEKIIDLTGTLYITDDSRSTDLWPLRVSGAGHGNVIDGADENFPTNKVYNRKDAAGGTGEKDWGVAGYTGIGYDRDVARTGVYGGTPGFPNDSLKEKPADIVDSVSISEIMVESNEGRYPQWIELRNTHMTNGVKLDAWKLRVENVGEVDARRQVTIDLPDGYRLAPNQTILIATRRGTSSDELSASRVIVLYNDSTARRALEVDSPRYTLLSKEGFTLKLFGKDQRTTETPVDMVTVGEDMLTETMIGDRTERVSLIRYYSTGIPGRLGSARDSNQVVNALSAQYYGVSDDIGTPGWYPGGALPVSLSSFRPERNKATGEVVVRWVTQSELNNAGFNILRSEKNGEFTVVNVKGIIPGHGTTSEKHVYTWTDTSAKPNVVYYYQIEDVSLDGKRTTLATTHLRGNVTAAGKVTTTWGDLKTQD